jgi:cysteinyl-tRNA synthetase
MLKLYDTMTRNIEVFTPRQDRIVKMFTCGPSIYQRPHIGNFRSFIWEDVLQRYLEYSGYKVERVLNFTDVEDKAIAEAKKEGTTLTELTNSIASKFFEDARILRLKKPTYNPRSSTSVDEAVDLIKILLEKGYAYWDKGDIFFDPLKFRDFGKLYRLDMSKWPKKKRHFRKDTYPGVQWNLGDFILWHGYKGGDEVYWETEIGKGRPAWNIQDAAMATKHLGAKIDISCGGIDNLYRHHDYTIAIIEAVFGNEFAKYWLHGEHLLINGKKMSKSKGNVLYVDNLLDEAYHPEDVRFYLITNQYRKRINYTKARFEEASKKLLNFKNIVKAITNTDSKTLVSDKPMDSLIHDLTGKFEDRMDEDLDVKGAFDILNKTVSKISKRKISNHDRERIVQELRKIDNVLQVIFP